MIVKILNKSSKEFNGVSYNDKKIDNGKGELLSMKNFPPYINSSSGTQDVKNYFKALSNNNKRIQNPQFHCAISAQGRTPRCLADETARCLGKPSTGDGGQDGCQRFGG